MSNAAEPLLSTKTSDSLNGMKAEQFEQTLRQLLRQEPFQPFVLLGRIFEYQLIMNLQQQLCF